MDIATSHIADADNQQILQLYRYFRRVQVELERLPDDLEKADELRDALNVLAARILQFEASTPMGVLCQMDAAEQFLSEDREEGLFLEVFQTIFQGGKRVMAAYNARQSERQHNRRRRMPRASRFDDASPWR